MSKGYQLLELA